MRWNEGWAPLFDRLTKLKSNWPTRGWTWDGRVGCVTSSFTVEVEKQARTAVAELYSEQWTSNTVARAPAGLRDVADRSGGVRQGQVVLSSPVYEGLAAFGLWWPWGDGETISLRIGLIDIDPARELYQKFRDVFNVTF